MTDEPTESENEWAWTQSSRMADGSLEGIALERMQRALETTRGCVGPSSARAPCGPRCVRREPRRCRPACDCRLLGIPGGTRVRWSWAAMPAAMFVAALTVLLMLRNAAPPQPDPRIVALQNSNRP